MLPQARANSYHVENGITKTKKKKRNLQRACWVSPSIMCPALGAHLAVGPHNQYSRPLFWPGPSKSCASIAPQRRPHVNTIQKVSLDTAGNTYAPATGTKRACCKMASSSKACIKVLEFFVSNKQKTTVFRPCFRQRGWGATVFPPQGALAGRLAGNTI